MQRIARALSITLLCVRACGCVWCAACAPVEMDVTLIGDVADRSGRGHKVTLKGNTTVSKGGARFDGKGDYATIKSFHYADNATFSIAFWMTKVQCANGVYEYV